LRDVLTLSNPPHILSDQREERLAFVMRWQQFTGPIVAKGVEDTALYVYYPLLSLNEVGGNPEPSKIESRENFVKFMQERQRRWPDSLNAGSTHDTKLSEDVRAMSSPKFPTNGPLRLPIGRPKTQHVKRQSKGATSPTPMRNT
jgi:(1->4)-alpha-D-glucan 1-alpha-D-glucosylmutase